MVDSKKFRVGFVKFVAFRLVSGWFQAAFGQLLSAHDHRFAGAPASLRLAVAEEVFGRFWAETLVDPGRFGGKMDLTKGRGHFTPQIPQNFKIELVGGLEHFLFSHILGIVIPIDEPIFFRGV